MPMSVEEIGDHTFPNLFIQEPPTITAKEMSDPQHFVPIDPTKPTFGDFLGEVRNAIYEYALPTDHTLHDLHFRYSPSRKKFRPTFPRCRSMVRALHNLSAMDREIRREARTFFYSNSSLLIQYRQNMHSDPSYLKIVTNFLDTMGQDGREGLAILGICCHGPLGLNRTWEPSEEQRTFSHLLGQRKVLRKIRMNLDLG
jgi:hypothetical protein